jgi:hypothetical protein
MRKFNAIALAFGLGLVLSAPASALRPSTLKNDLTVTGALSVGGAVTLTTPLTAANIQTGSAKRQTETVLVCPASGSAANSTVYRAFIYPARACTVKQIGALLQTAPTAASSCTLKVLKASSAGNTMLSTANIDAGTLVANTGLILTPTSTSADLALTATQGIYVEYSQATPAQAAANLNVTVEIEPTDF